MKRQGRGWQEIQSMGSLTKVSRKNCLRDENAMGEDPWSEGSPPASERWFSAQSCVQLWGPPGALGRLPRPWPCCAESLILSSLVAALWSQMFFSLLFLFHQIIVSSILVCLSELHPFRQLLSGTRKASILLEVIGCEWGIDPWGTALMGYHQSLRLLNARLFSLGKGSVRRRVIKPSVLLLSLTIFSESLGWQCRKSSFLRAGLAMVTGSAKMSQQ